MEAWTKERKASFKASAKRHTLPGSIVLAALLVLLFVGDPLWRNNFFHITLTGLPEACLKISLYLLTMRYVFPALKIQESLNAGNIAIAILAGTVFIGIANIF